MQAPKRLWSLWFNNRTAISRLPEACIEECSMNGPVDGACEYWAERLNLEAPAWLLREYLEGFGCWTKAELCDHQDNLMRLVWLWSCDCRERGDNNYLIWLGI